MGKMATALVKSSLAGSVRFYSLFSVSPPLCSQSTHSILVYALHVLFMSSWTFAIFWLPRTFHILPMSGEFCFIKSSYPSPDIRYALSQPPLRLGYNTHGHHICPYGTLILKLLMSSSKNWELHLAKVAQISHNLNFQAPRCQVASSGCMLCQQ
jgi:hypothetical protein